MAEFAFRETEFWLNSILNYDAHSEGKSEVLQSLFIAISSSQHASGEMFCEWYVQ